MRRLTGCGITAKKDLTAFFRGARGGVVELRQVLVLQAAMAAVAVLAGRPLAYVVWIGSWATLWGSSNRLRSIAEHGGMIPSRDRRETTHVTRQSRLARFWMVPYNTGWHLAHHADMGVPWRNLPTLHAELVASGWITDAVEYPSYMAFWRAASSRPELQNASPRSPRSNNYPVVDIDRGVAKLCRALLRLPGALPLAVTAAAEHYTGTLAPIFLDDKTRDVLLFASDELATLVRWHALEELEHKNVAFDVLAEVDGRYLTRMAEFGVLVATLGVYGALSWARAVRRDRNRITPEHRRAFRANLRRQSLLSPRTAWETLAYLRPGFHPDDTNTDDLVEHWRGMLAGRTVTRSAL